MWRAVVRAGSVGAAVGAAHAVVNAALLRRPGPAPDDPAPRVSVLVPARDEAHRIAGCLRGLLAQPVAEIVVLDDGSRDGTAEVVREVAGADPRVRLLTGRTLPPGWLGKPHACHQLAAAADPRSTHLAFVDADVTLAPGAVPATVELARSAGLDLVCPYPRQVAHGPAERLVQPLLQWSWLTFLPLRLAERSRRPSLGAANGQFLVVRREVYDRAGGHAAVRSAVLEDMELLRAVKRVGGTGGVVDGTELADCRMYEGWADLRDGYGKSLWSAFGSPAKAAAVSGLLAGLYVAPAVAALHGSRTGLAGYLAGVGGRAVTGWRTGSRVWPDAFAHPVSVGLLNWLTLRSWSHRRAGALMWKSRRI